MSEQGKDGDEPARLTSGAAEPLLPFPPVALGIARELSWRGRF